MTEVNFSVRRNKSNLWLIKRGFKTIVDVGANEGQFAKKMRIMFPDCSIHSFEPLDQVYKTLTHQFANDDNFFAYNYALGNKDEKARIYLNEYNPSSSLLKMGEEHKKHFDFAKKEVPADIFIKRLDDILNDDLCKKPILLKIDVQGFEDQVIAGGKEFVKSCDMIIVEVSFRELYINQPLFHEIYEVLYPLGFRYSGNYEQLVSPEDGTILQADAIFLKENK